MGSREVNRLQVEAMWKEEQVSCYLPKFIVRLFLDLCLFSISRSYMKISIDT